MKTFIEWVEVNHPNELDEGILQNIGQGIKRIGPYVAPAVVAGAALFSPYASDKGSSPKQPIQQSIKQGGETQGGETKLSLGDGRNIQVPSDKTKWISHLKEIQKTRTEMGNPPDKAIDNLINILRQKGHQE